MTGNLHRQQSVQQNTNSSVAFSCFLDDDAIMKVQACIWLKTLIYIQHVDPQSIYIHTVPNLSIGLDWAHAERVNIVEVPPFDPRSKHCNKIQQLPTFFDLAYDQVVFMDCDTAWVGDHTLPVGSPVAAKIVDKANPPAEVLRNIFKAAGLGEPVWTNVSFAENDIYDITDINNCNGGVYICSVEFLPRLASCWKRWAFWCLRNLSLFEKSSVHVDQVSFALAMRELETSVNLLPLDWNYPTHLNNATNLPRIRPQIIHYHREILNSMEIKMVGIKLVDKAICRINNLVSRQKEKNVLNGLLWEFCFAKAASITTIDSKVKNHASFISSIMHDRLPDDSCCHIVDIGCGALEGLPKSSLANYTGLCISKKFFAFAKTKYPSLNFLWLQPENWQMVAGEIVLCLDILIHQQSKSEFLKIIDYAVSAALDTLIISGFEEPPTLTASNNQFHIPLSEALKNTGQITRIELIGSYLDVSVFVAERCKQRASTFANIISTNHKVVVASGWWCDQKPHAWALGSPKTRERSFFNLWYRQVTTCLDPCRIIVTDSASPLKPDFSRRKDIQWIELDQNYGHANDLRKQKTNLKYSGFTRSVMNGAMYALSCEADFFVYVEQDCLLFGENLLHHAITSSQAGIWLGAPTENGRGIDGIAASMVQQSLIIVAKSELERFLVALLTNPASDGEVSPEETMRQRLAPFEYLNIPFGRSRPIDFSRPHFYAQHLDERELQQFTSML